MDKLIHLQLLQLISVGATEIYKRGGVQAIGALSYGTKSISKVDKIVGPGGVICHISKIFS